MRYRVDAVREFRKRRGLRVHELAVRAGISPRQVFNLENGKVPRADTLARLSKALAVPIEQFFRRTA